MKYYNYLEDKFALACLEEAKKGKSYIGFGAVLVRDSEILFRGRNRRSTAEDRALLSHVDYAIHAEQDVIAQALRNDVSLEGTEVYVVGIVLKGINKGTLTIRTSNQFGCSKCPHSFIKYKTPINIPLISGWSKLSPEESMITGNEFRRSEITWQKFSKGVVSL